MSAATLEMWVIYERPRDYPDSFVVRRWLIEKGSPVPTDTIRVVASLEEAREQVPAGLYRMDRQPVDDPYIAEVWV